MKSLLKYIIVLIVFLLLFFSIKSFFDSNENKERLISETSLIEKEINNVRKLIVTEMKYAKVYTYENTKSYGWEYFTSQKRAIIISNARAQISYNLKDLEHQIDPESKTIYITYIPKPELRIDPDLIFYQIDDGLVNRFEGRDYNNIKKKIKADLKEEIENDAVMKNAQNRLLSELSSLYIVSSSLGWKLMYNETEINSTKEMDTILF
jgi:hypothetical protein